MSHPHKSSPQKTTHHVVAVGVFCGLIFFLELQENWLVVQTFVMFIRKIGEMIQFDEHIFHMGWFNHQVYRKELSQIFLHGSKMKDDSQLEDSQILSKLPFLHGAMSMLGPLQVLRKRVQWHSDSKMSKVFQKGWFPKASTRWWFHTFCFYFHPLFGEDEPILTHIFQVGWFNHQLVYQVHTHTM